MTSFYFTWHSHSNFISIQICRITLFLYRHYYDYSSNVCNTLRVFFFILLQITHLDALRDWLKIISKLRLFGSSWFDCTQNSCQNQEITTFQQEKLVFEWTLVPWVCRYFAAIHNLPLLRGPSLSLVTTAYHTHRKTYLQNYDCSVILKVKIMSSKLWWRKKNKLIKYAKSWLNSTQTQSSFKMIIIFFRHFFF